MSIINKIKIGAEARDIGVTWSNVANHPTSMPASDVHDWAKANSKPTYTWNEIANKPTEFTPASHSHDVATQSANGFMSSTDKTKLDGIATGAQVNTITGIKGNAESSYRTGNVNLTPANIGAIASSEKGSASGIATLGRDGKIPSSQLPSYVDDVLEYTNMSSFPETGESGKIYVDTTANLTYRWSGTKYTEISPSLALGETSSTAFPGDRGKAVESSLSSHAGNSDIHITSSEKTSWNNKYDKPSSGIPKTDLASGVQTSLGKADTAWQNPSSTTTTINGTLSFNGGDQNGASKINLGANGQITRETATIFGFQNNDRLDVGSTSYPVNIRTNNLSYNGNKFVSSTNSTANWGETVTVGTVAGTDLKFVMPANPSSDGNYLPLSGGTVTGATSFTNTTASTSTSTGAVKISGGLGVGGAIYADTVHGAVWNDLADSIIVDNDCVLEYGCCYCFNGKKYTKSSKYLDDGIIGIHSDTYGFKMGSEEGKKKMDVAVSGFVLAYVDKEYPVGTPLTCTENGYLTEIKKEDKIEYPERIVATYWKNEPSEEWGTEDRKVKVNGRKWVKIK